MKPTISQFGKLISILTGRCIGMHNYVFSHYEKNIVVMICTECKHEMKFMNRRA